ncbi:hypothetical protein WEI85_07710 [Actinomycetes bacterium KLBMP 9797]
MNRKDYQEVASALLSAAARLDGELEPGGAFESIDRADARRLLAVLAGGMADWFAEHNPYRFNPEAFLSACGLLEDVTAVTPARTGRRTNEPIAHGDVKVGDCLRYVTGGGQNYAGIVTKVTDLTVRLEHGWNLDMDFEMAKVTLRRANWSRHHVRLMDSTDTPGPSDAPQPNAASVASQAFPHPPGTEAPATSAELAPTDGSQPPRQARRPR